MDTIQDKLSLKHGHWLAVNCGSMPQSKCHLVIMAPDSEKSDLVDAAVAHVTKRHGQKDTKELRSQLDKSLGSITL
jgi:hypothetical protein